MYTLTEVMALLREHRISSLELTQTCLANIGRLDPLLNVFITVTEEAALRQAKQADQEIAAGKCRGPLHGIPIALKDLIDVAGVPTTAASRQFTHHVPAEDAAVVTHLKEAGAVILGKTNLHEFAFGGSGMISAYGPTRNPWDTARITGGSSSGAAAAVAVGMCLAAVGTDTAGSIRTPSALCGIVGHRPSAGVCSLKGVIPLRASFDTAGPMTQTVEDARLLLNALADAQPTAFDAQPLNTLRIGIPRDGFFGDLDLEVATALNHAIDVFRTLCAEVREVKLQVDVPWTDFDEEILQFHRLMLEESPELYQPATLERLKACIAIPEAEYQRARAELTGARQNAERIFDDVDLIVTPTCLVSAPTIDDLRAMSNSDLRSYEVQKLLKNTAPFSLLFWPSVSVPCGFTGNGLPIGMQISARPGADDLALRTAQAYEQATAWHLRRPQVGL